MIYTDQQLVKKIRKMIVDFEDEIVNSRKHVQIIRLKILENIFRR